VVRLLEAKNLKRLNRRVVLAAPELLDGRLQRAGPVRGRTPRHLERPVPLVDNDLCPPAEGLVLAGHDVAHGLDELRRADGPRRDRQQRHVEVVEGDGELGLTTHSQPPNGANANQSPTPSRSPHAQINARSEAGSGGSPSAAASSSSP